MLAGTFYTFALLKLLLCWIIETCLHLYCARQLHFGFIEALLNSESVPGKASQDRFGLPDFLYSISKYLGFQLFPGFESLLFLLWFALTPFKSLPDMHWISNILNNRIMKK